MLRRARRSPLFAALVLFASVASTMGSMTAPTVAQASPSTSAALLVDQGAQQESAGNALLAIKRYSDAMSIDPAYEPAYVALATLREKRKELKEAEEVYAAAIARIPTSVALVVGRGHVRRLLGKLADAADDLQHALAAVSDRSLAVVALRELVAVKRLQIEPAAELGAWRRLLALAHANNDSALEKEAGVQARALGIFLGEVDPALAGSADPDAVRRALAAIASRQ